MRWIIPLAYSVAALIALGWAGLPAPAIAGDLDIRMRQGDGTPLADTVVTLWPVGGAVPVGPESERGEAVITQRDQRFIPHVRVVDTGTTIRFPNEDDIKHHVYSFSDAKQFQIRLYGGGEVRRVDFPRPGVVVLGCNIHDHMLAYVYVTDAPYFAKTDKTGRAQVTGLPAGSYRAEVWHPRMKADSVLEKRVTVKDEEAAEMTLSLAVKPPQRRRERGASGY